MNGLLLIDKPVTWTSFDAVKKVRSVIEQNSGKRIKVGHAGTLDPLASGLLILALGPATKELQYLLKLPKTYEAEATFGANSTTGDKEGELTQISQQAITKDQIEAALPNFRGQISQVPPAHSAIKVNGKRAYKLARKGEAVELAPREVTIYELHLNKYKWPKAELTCTVSSGTYIRTLIEDIGSALKVGAYTSSLRRTSIGDYDVNNAISPEGLEMDAIASHLKNVA